MGLWCTYYVPRALLCKYPNHHKDVMEIFNARVANCEKKGICNKAVDGVGFGLQFQTSWESSARN